MTPLRDQFENDVEAFLAKFATSVRGASGEATASGGKQVKDLLAAQGFAKPSSTISVNLTAPLVTASFTKTHKRENKELFTFAKSQVEVRLDTHTGAADLPVYLIPYDGGTAQGVKLPDQTTDGLPVAYAMTASQNGCTVEISGTASSPYASHTNVIDVKDDSKGIEWKKREAAINLRLLALQTRFRMAESATGGSKASVDNNRVQFGFFDQTAKSNWGLNAATFLNYKTDIYENVVTQHKGKDWKSARTDKMLSHVNYICTPTDNAIQAATDRKDPPQALVVGCRKNNTWTFYYQVYRPMAFKVREVYKMGNLVLSTDTLTNKEGGEPFYTMVILDYGELWPNYTSHPATFGTGI